MSTQHFDDDSLKKFTLSGFLAFAAVFSVLMLMMRCHGDFVPTTENTHSTSAAESHETEKPAKTPSAE